MIDLTPDIYTYFLHNPDFDRIQYFVGLDYIKAPYGYAWDDPSPIFWKSFKKDFPYLFREECWATIWEKRIISEVHYLNFRDPLNFKYFDLMRPVPNFIYPRLTVEAIFWTKLIIDPSTKITRKTHLPDCSVEHLKEIMNYQWFYPDITNIGIEEFKMPPEKIDPVELFETYFMNFFS